MLPVYFENREKKLLGSRFQNFFAYNDEIAKGITVNKLRCTPEIFSQLADFQIIKSEFCEEGYAVTDPEFKPGRHPYHHAGAFYSQEPSASAPAALLQVEPGMKVLDMCAAPGGKSSQLAAALQGKGLLVSNEFNAGRAEILKSNLERMGVSNAVITSGDTGALAKSFPSFFDRVLVDAPCSGEGMFRKEPQAITQHCENLVKQCAAIGAEILENAISVLAPGGLMMYSTCTFSPEEDEGQIAQLLHSHPEMELLPLDVKFGSEGEMNRCGSFSMDVTCVRRIWPSQGGEGHFMALLKKAGDVPSNLNEKKKKAEFPKTQKSDAEWVKFAQMYFPNLANRKTIMAGEMLLMPVEELLPKIKSRVLRNGVMLGSLRKNRFEPGHHLFMVYGKQCTNREEMSLADPRVNAWLRGEEIEAKTAENGWCAVLVDGFPLGGGKVSGGKVKNHYPKALRNLK